MSRPDKAKTLGLAVHLNRTASQHRGMDYSVFKAMMQGNASTASMARTFKVSRATMEKWKLLYDLDKSSKSKK